MFYHFLFPLSDQVGFFNLFQYLTFRTGGTIMTSLVLSFLIGPYLISWLKHKQDRAHPLRPEIIHIHFHKRRTPTMGGVLLLITTCLSTLLWADLTNGYIWIVLVVLLSYGMIGFADDYLKITQHNPYGLRGPIKFLGQIGIAICATLLCLSMTPDHLATSLSVPFFKDILIDLGWFFVPFAVFVIVGSSNAVNLTDGLDGLAIVPAMIVAASFGLIVYLVGNVIFSTYLQLQYVPGIGELAILCGALVGSGLGFLWFNAPPAMIFMGDTGSLSIGGALGVISVIAKHEIVLAIIGGLFVLETISVIIQVVSFKLVKKRVFRMAPLHHHFEQKGWSESTIIIRFWIIATILALIGLSTLKLR